MLITKNTVALKFLWALWVVSAPIASLAQEEPLNCAYDDSKSQTEKAQQVIKRSLTQNGKLDLKELLKSADVNNDQKITVKEAVYGGLSKNFYLKLDTHRKGYITPEDVNRLLHYEMVEEMWRSFRIGDRNRDGCISKLEMGISNGRLARNFEQIDRSSEGCVSFLDMVDYRYPNFKHQAWFRLALKEHNVFLEKKDKDLLNSPR